MRLLRNRLARTLFLLAGQVPTDSLRVGYRGDFDILHDAVDFGGILGTHHDLADALRIVLCLPQHTVDHAVAFCIGHKTGHVLILDGKDGQFLAAAEHGGQTLPPLDLVLVPVFQGGDQQRRYLLGRTACDLGCHLHALQTEPDDLFGGVTGCVHVAVPPSVDFSRPPGRLSVSPPSRRSALQCRRTDAPPGAAL